jgi:hypothetical protein
MKTEEMGQVPLILMKPFPSSLKYRGTPAQFFFRFGLGFFSWNAGGVAPSVFGLGCMGGGLKA